MIPPIAPLPPLPSTGGAAGAGATAGAGGAGASGGGFGTQVTNALNQVQQVQNQASNLQAQAAAGQGNITDAMVAATKAQLYTQVTVALTNKAISAFTNVMNLQV